MDIIVLTFIIAWIIIVPIAWLTIRRFKPHWIGLGADFNKQRIDGVKYHECPDCESGRMEPRFKQSIFKPFFGIPPGLISRVGTPEVYVCLNCGKVLDGNFFGDKFTRVSLASRVPSKEVLRSILIFAFLLLLTFLFVVYAF